MVGVGKARPQEGDDNDNRIIYLPFNAMDVLQDNHYITGIWLSSEGLDHTKLTQDYSRFAGVSASLPGQR